MPQKLLLFLFLFTQLFSFAQKDVLVENISMYNAAIKNATPGTNIILKDGVWEDVHLSAYGKGNKENPIVIKAENAGKVILTGDSKLEIYGEYIIVQGLWFKDGTPSTIKNVVSFKKNSEEFANNCRFTNSTISNYNPDDMGYKTNWVSLWGKNNRVDHNNFTGKSNKGPTLVVWLKGKAHLENNHSIDANFFGPRTELGENGGETIRIGTSTYSMESSKTIVKNNTFKKCNGDIEIVSNKSGDNVFQNNLFIESKGTLTLRHGNNALVENNVFLGNNTPKTGGIRIINEGHVIRNNLFVGLRGRANNAPISVIYGVPNSPLKRYHQVKNVSIQNNTLINCSTIDFALSKDDERTLAPIQTLFANNLVTNTDGTNVIDPADDISGIFFKNNIAETSAEIDTRLFSKQKVEWKLLKSLPMPTSANKDLVSDYTNPTTPRKDIIGLDREPFVVGAFNLDNTKYPRALTVKSGPYWTPNIIIEEEYKNLVVIEPGLNTIYRALKNATPGTTFKLKNGIYYFDKEQKIDDEIRIIGSKNSILKSAKKLEKPFKSFFKVNEKSTLRIKNVTFDGGENNVKYAIISPSKNIAAPYKLFVDNCKFKNFENPKGATIKAYTNTVADTISIKNSIFSDNFRGLHFSSKENTVGKANANTMIIHNTVFKNIEQHAIKFIKNMSDLNPNKGKLSISNCVFSKVADTEKGKVINIKNITYTEIKNSVFQSSPSIVNPISLSGPGNKMYNCVVSSAGKVKNTKGAIAKNILYKTPKWDDKKKFTPSKKSILLKENNQIGNIGLLR